VEDDENQKFAVKAWEHHDCVLEIGSKTPKPNTDPAKAASSQRYKPSAFFAAALAPSLWGVDKLTPIAAKAILNNYLVADPAAPFVNKVMNHASGEEETEAECTSSLANYV